MGWIEFKRLIDDLVVQREDWKSAAGSNASSPESALAQAIRESDPHQIACLLLAMNDRGYRPDGGALATLYIQRGAVTYRFKTFEHTIWVEQHPGTDNMPFERRNYRAYDDEAGIWNLDVMQELIRSTALPGEAVGSIEPPSPSL